MITAHKKYHGKRLPLSVKRSIGIESLKETATIVDISNRFKINGRVAVGGYPPTATRPLVLTAQLGMTG